MGLLRKQRTVSLTILAFVKGLADFLCQIFFCDFINNTWNVSLFVYNSILSCSGIQTVLFFWSPTGIQENEKKIFVMKKKQNKTM